MKKKLTSLKYLIGVKKGLLCIVFMTTVLSVNAQSCSELMASIKSNYYGTTYYSPVSDAISQVTFYDVTIDYNFYYFAIVTFKGTYTSRDYLYQVSSNTKFNYSMHYIQSAGNAFHKYIKPYDSNLNCGQ